MPATKCPIESQRSVVFRAGKSLFSTRTVGWVRQFPRREWVIEDECAVKGNGLIIRKRRSEAGEKSVAYGVLCYRMFCEE